MAPAGGVEAGPQRGFAALGVGNQGITNVGTLIVPNGEGPAKVEIEGNVQQVVVPAAAKLKELKVLSLGADTDLFPGIPRQFTGAGTIVKVTVEKDVTDYTFQVPGAVDQMVVGGSITGSELSFARTLKLFSVQGDVEGSTLSFARKVGKLTVKGDVDGSEILAGYNEKQEGVNADAQIGTINIAGVLRASNLVAGAGRGADGIFGTADDQLIGSGRPGVIASIARIVLGGVEGTGATGDGFGIVAEEIGKLKIGGTPVRLAPDARNDLTPIPLLPDGSTDDFYAREVVPA